MKRNEKILVGALLAGLAAWQGSGWISSTVFEPFQKRGEDLATLRKSVKDKEDQLLNLSRSRKSLKEWQSTSLPPDPGKPKQPTALNAQRLYTQWLTDLGQLCGVEYLKVTPGGITQKGNVYLSVLVRLEGEVRYEQLISFLDFFYRTNLLHRIATLQVATKVFEGDPGLRISLEAEGLVLLDAPSRRTLFPETALAESLTENGTTLQVTDLEGFPNQAGFRIQVKNEFLVVTAMDGKNWTVERAVERTQSAAYSEDATIELVKMNSERFGRTLEEFQQMIATNIFVKPAPPYKMKLAPLSEKAFARGKSNDFTIAAQGYDTTKGKPEFAIVGSAPTGLKLDKSGKVTWRPGDDVAAGRYPVQFEVRHASAPHGSLAGTFTVRLRDSKTPRLAPSTPPKVYLNREWTYLPALVATDPSPTRFTWKLGDKSPEGLSINEKSGELKWTPGDSVEIGETPVSIVATDSDSPPQSTTFALKLDIHDDAAQFTRLVGTLADGDKKRGFLIDQSTDKKTVLHEGDAFAISDLSGKIKQIGGNHIIMTLGQQDVRWDVGQSLREAQATIKEY